LQYIRTKYTSSNHKLLLTKRKHKMFTIIEKFISLLDRFSSHQTDLERFIIAHNPAHGGDVDNLIKQFTYGKRGFV